MIGSHYSIKYLIVDTAGNEVQWGDLQALSMMYFENGLAPSTHNTYICFSKEVRSLIL